MKKLTQDQYNQIINKELAIHGKTVEDIKDDDRWFMTYTMTEQQSEEWKSWTIDYIIKTCKCSKAVAEREFSWIYLNHGLKIV